MKAAGQWVTGVIAAKTRQICVGWNGSLVGHERIQNGNGFVLRYLLEVTNLKCRLLLTLDANTHRIIDFRPVLGFNRVAPGSWVIGRISAKLWEDRMNLTSVVRI